MRYVFLLLALWAAISSGRVCARGERMVDGRCVAAQRGYYVPSTLN